MAAVPHNLKPWVEKWRTQERPEDEIRDELVEKGYQREVIEAVVRAATRPLDQHRLAYWVLFWSMGLAALFLGTALHFGLDQLLGVERAPEIVAAWVTGALVAVPIAIGSLNWVVRMEADDPDARFSQTRENLGRVLLWASGIIGIGRLLEYVNSFVVAVLRGETAEVLNVGLWQVMVTLAIAGGLFYWAWGFVGLADKRQPSGKEVAVSS